MSTSEIKVCLQQEGEGTVSAMVVEKQKLDNKVKEMKDRVQVGPVTQLSLPVLVCRDAGRMSFMDPDPPPLLFIRWRIRALRTWRTSRTSTTSRSTR